MYYKKTGEANLKNIICWSLHESREPGKCHTFLVFFLVFIELSFSVNSFSKLSKRNLRITYAKFYYMYIKIIQKLIIHIKIQVKILRKSTSRSFAWCLRLRHTSLQACLCSFSLNYWLRTTRRKVCIWKPKVRTLYFSSFDNKEKTLWV